MSNYARLIQSEKVYQEKIRQLEAKVIELSKEKDRLETILGEWEVPNEVWEILETEPVKPWTMFHDPNGNQY